MNPNKRIIRLNASAIKHAACIRKLWFTIIDGYKSKRNSAYIEYGTAFHKIAQSLSIDSADTAKAITAGQEHLSKSGADYNKMNQYMDEFHLTRTAMAYIAEMKKPPFDSSEVLKFPDGTPLVEQKFSVPVYSDDSYDILLEGTIDRIVKIRNGCICIEDWKSTNKKDPEQYFKSYKLSSQLLTYLFGLKQHILAFPNSPLASMLINNPKIGCRIIGVFIDPKEPVQFRMSNVFFYTDEQLIEYYHYLNSLCCKLVGWLKTNTLPFAEGHFNGYCQTAYGNNCTFFDLCASLPNIGEAAMRQVALRSFKKEEYLPLREK